MKKILIVLLMVLCLAGTSYAKMMPQGMQEIDVEGSLDGKSGAGTSIWLAGGWGYFIIDNLELQIAGAFMRNAYFNLYAPALGAVYSFDIGSDFIPFAGINIGWGFTDYREGKDLNAFVYGIEGGVNYFLSDNVAIDAAVDWDWATDNIFDDNDGKMTNNNLTAHTGLRYFLK